MSDYLSESIQLARDWDLDRERTQQTEPGWSGMAGCRAWLGYSYRGDWATDDVDTWRAEVGTVLHDLWWAGLRAEWAARAGKKLAHKTEGAYRGVRGHMDEVDYTDGDVTDWKFPAMKSVWVWDDPQVQDEKFIQLQGYAAVVVDTPEWQEAAAAAGRDPEQVTVRLLVMPVDGTFDDWRVYERPFDRAVADAAVDRYEWVKAESDAGRPLQKDKHLTWCEKFCEFFTACRGDRQDDEEWPEILDAETAAALALYGQSRDEETAAGKAKDAAAALIRGHRGQARGWRVSMTNRGDPKLVTDLAQMEADYANSNLPIPKVPQPGAAPSLHVVRVPAERSRSRKPARQDD